MSHPRRNYLAIIYNSSINVTENENSGWRKRKSVAYKRKM